MADQEEALTSAGEEPEEPDRPAGEPGSQQPAEHLTLLPVRIHVVLGEKDFTLKELEALQEGAVIELDRPPDDQVDLAVNGRLLGKGRLVEIEGRLGVLVQSWRDSK